MASLDDIRKKIDALDEQLVNLLEQRAQLALAVRGVKSKQDLRVYSPAREREILERVAKLGNDGDFPVASLGKIFRTILSATRSLVGEIAVAYVGPEGSIAHAVGLRQFGGDATFQPELKIDDVFQRVSAGDVHYGVVSYESAATGLEPATLRLLKESSLRIVAEVPFSQQLALWSSTESLSSVRRIFAEPSSLMACRSWLQANVPGAEVVIVDTHLAAAERARGETAAAILAVDSEFAADLKRLATGLEERATRDVRFLVIGNEDLPQSGKDKTALLCFVEDRPGALRDILEVFSRQEITLRKVESKPLQEEAGAYYFFIELVGHQHDPAVAKALEALAAVTSRFKILGSYPVPPES